jgi:hypothetical protein
MKSKSKQCPNGHGAMNRCHIKTNKTIDGIVKQKWIAIKWQYCPDCKMMLVD